MFLPTVGDGLPLVQMPTRLALLIAERVAVARDAAPRHLEADELARRARLLDPRERVLADEVALVRA